MRQGFSLFQRGVVWMMVVMMSVMNVSCTTGPQQRVTSGADFPSDGISRHELVELVGHPGRVQFKRVAEGSELLCVRYNFVDDYNSYFFLFEADELDSIYRWKDISEYTTVPYRGSKKSVEANWLPEVRIAKMLEAEGLSLEEFEEELRIYEEKKSKKGGGHGPGNLWPLAPLFIIAAPFFIVSEPIYATKYSRLYREFDGDKVSLGMSEAKVIQVYGEPVFKVVEGGGVMMAFGPEKWLRENPKGKTKLWVDHNDFWVAVHFDDGVVIGVYSDYFFHEDSIVQIGNLVGE